jgi:hypothetical protein
MNSCKLRTAHRCELQVHTLSVEVCTIQPGSHRLIDCAVYSLSTLKGVHSSSTTIRSAPSSRCVLIDNSGVKNLCELWHTYK